MPAQQKAAKTWRRIGFRTAILQLVLGAIFLTVGTVGVVGYVNSARTLDKLRERQFSLVSLALSREVTRMLEAADRILLELKDLSDRSLVNVKDTNQLALFISERLRQEESVSAIGFSNSATGGSLNVWRDTDGAIVTNQTGPQDDDGKPTPVNPVFDPRRQSWYRAALETGGRIAWTKPYALGDGTLGVTASIAASQGVFSADFSTSDVDGFLSRLIQGRMLMLFVDTPSSDLLGVASGLDTSSDLMLERCRALYGSDWKNLEIGHVSVHSFRVDSESYVLVVTPFTLQSGFTFLTGVVGAESEFLGPAQSNLVVTAMIGLIAIALGTVLAIWLSHHLATPLIKLSRDLEQVGQFQLTNSPSPKSAVREIAIVGDSFDRMKAGLRSFIKYVPRDVVRELVLQKQDASRGGALRRLTLFFSDVAGFTRMSENLGESQVFIELGDYFELVTEIIVDKFGGTLDKFVGDGVVAFFNAPADVPNHAEIGCRAALEIVTKLSNIEEERRAAGRPVFRSRIGLHTGEVLVGNIGTHHRLAYTVLGDAVNLTSRLEGLNKLYGTLILASRDTKEETGNSFEWRYIDRVAVRGRSKSTDIFELIGYPGNVARMKLENRDEYERGLDKYFAKDFAGASVHFDAVLSRDPRDMAARLLLARCSELSLREPPVMWSGVYEMLEK